MGFVERMLMQNSDSDPSFQSIDCEPYFNNETMIKNPDVTLNVVAQVQRLPDSWLGLMVGNSRLHWVWFEGALLKSAWNMPHVDREAIALLITQLDFQTLAQLPKASDWLPHLPSDLPPSHLPLWFASVVPSQTEFWQTYTHAHKIMLGQIPIVGLYPTLGIDRALALLGAIQTLGAPTLVIDAGTALTFTGVDAKARLVGGAILPGLQLQMRSLHEHTALPLLRAQNLTQDSTLSPRWALSTPEAIKSGILYTLLAGLQDFVADWLQQFPESAIVITGGDRLLLLNLLQQHFPQIAAAIKLDANLIFWGIQAMILIS
jgi:type III pantothenate kinase